MTFFFTGILVNKDPAYSVKVKDVIIYQNSTNLCFGIVYLKFLTK